MAERGRRGVHPFVAFLHEVRVKQKLTMKAVFDLGGPRPVTISKLELGVQQPTAYTLDRLAQALGFRLAMVDGKGNVYEFDDEYEFPDVE